MRKTECQENVVYAKKSLLDFQSIKFLLLKSVLDGRLIRTIFDSVPIGRLAKIAHLFVGDIKQILSRFF